jgi:hypothetical protein
MEVTVFRTSLTLSAAAALVALAACRDSTSAGDTAARDALQRDLDLAQASAVSLAQHELPPTRFVSALEQGERPSAGTGAAALPSRKKTPNKAPRHQAQHAAPAVAAVAQHEAPQAAAADMAPAPASTSSVASTESASTPTEQPTVAGPSDQGVVGSVPSDSRGTDNGAGNGSGEGRRGRGIGGIFGGVIGVVIRGGGIGDGDHCERDHPRGGRIPGGIGGIYGGLPMPGIPSRVPSGGGIGFPGRRY